MKYIATISGGKDSVAMCDLLLKNGYPIDYILFNDTGLEFKEMYKYIDKVESYFKERYNKEIIRTKPKKTFEELIFGKRVRGQNEGKVKGFFSASIPFCDLRSYAKDYPTKEFLKKNNITEYTMYIGYTNNEKKRAKSYKDQNPNSIFPLIEYFDMSEDDCKRYLIEQEMENPLYRHFNRTGCKFCHYQSEDAWFKIWKYYNDEWQELKALEQKLLEMDAVSPHIFLEHRTTDDMEKLFKAKDKQNSLFDFSDEPIKDCFCKI